MVIEDRFEGWLPVEEEYVFFAATGFIFNVIASKPGLEEAQNILKKFVEKHNEKGKYIQAVDTNLHRIAILNAVGNLDFLLPQQGIKLSTPIIIKSTGNTGYFFHQLVNNWEQFDAISFVGGNINTIHNPKRALLEIQEPNPKNYQPGELNIRVIPFSEHTLKVPVKIKGKNAMMVVSSSSSGLGNKSTRSIGYADSLIRLEFDTPQRFNSILDYFNTIKDLTALLTKHFNVRFATTLNQKISTGSYLDTAICKMNDGHTNYLDEFYFRTVQIGDLLTTKNGTDVLSNLIANISNNGFHHIRRLLVDDNTQRGTISINDVGFLCSALEVECDKCLAKTDKNVWINGLKKEIKSTIKKYETQNPLSDTYKDSNISSCFQYLNYTLKDRIYELYLAHKTLVDQYTEKWRMPALDLESIGNFVRMRNKSTHEGVIFWNGSEQIYDALFYLLYISFFSRAGMCDEDIENVLHLLF